MIIFFAELVVAKPFPTESVGVEVDQIVMD